MAKGLQVEGVVSLHTVECQGQLFFVQPSIRVWNDGCLRLSVSSMMDCAARNESRKAHANCTMSHLSAKTWTLLVLSLPLTANETMASTNSFVVVVPIDLLHYS